MVWSKRQNDGQECSKADLLMSFSLVLLINYSSTCYLELLLLTLHIPISILYQSCLLLSTICFIMSITVYSVSSQETSMQESVLFYKFHFTVCYR